MDERPRPVDVSVFRGRRELAIEWSDGHRGVHRWEALRWNCPCAVCQGEMGAPGQLQFVQRLTTDQTTLVDLREIGRYALQPVWQDGHDTGIYAHDHLRSLCECSACDRTRRVSRPDSPSR